MRERTRDRERFPLVFAENCSYGFRRNLWALKSVGVTLAVLGLGAIVLRAYAEWNAIPRVLSPLTITAMTITLALLLMWAFWVNPEWVRAASERYGERLLAASDNIDA